MPYTISTLTLAQIRASVAASSGSEGNTPMETLATRAVQSALQRWSTFWNWAYLKTTAPNVQVYGALTFNAAFSVGPPIQTLTITGDSSTLIASGDVVIGGTSPWFTPGALYVKTVTLLTGNTILNFTLDPSGSGATYTFPDAAQSQSVGLTIGRRRYSLPTTARTIYSVRLLAANRVLRPIQQREEDRALPTPIVEIPWGYTLFNADAASAKISLVPFPATNDFMAVRYMREPTIASASGDVLDIPRDAEFCITSLAKGYYLMDKGEDKAAFWSQAGETALRELRARELQEIDAEPRFQREGSLYPWGQEEY